MSLDTWSLFHKHKYDINYLISLAKYNSNSNIFVIAMKYQINLITIKLCIKRDNLGIPKELWDIICGYIKKNIQLCQVKYESEHKAYCNLVGQSYSHNKRIVIKHK